jgi:hypothetical protein
VTPGYLDGFGRRFPNWGSFIRKASVKATSKIETPLPEPNGPEKPGRWHAPKEPRCLCSLASQAGHLAFAHFASAGCAPADVLGRRSGRSPTYKMENRLSYDAVDVGTHAHDPRGDTPGVGVRGHTMPLVSTPVHPSEVGGGHPESGDSVEKSDGCPPVHPIPLTGWVRTPGVRGVVRTLQESHADRPSITLSLGRQSGYRGVHPGGGHPPSKGWTGVDRGGHLGGVSL